MPSLRSLTVAARQKPLPDVAAADRTAPYGRGSDRSEPRPSRSGPPSIVAHRPIGLHRQRPAANSLSLFAFTLAIIASSISTPRPGPAVA